MLYSFTRLVYLFARLVYLFARLLYLFTRLLYSFTRLLYSFTRSFTDLPVQFACLPVYFTRLPVCFTCLPVCFTRLSVWFTYLPVWFARLPVCFTRLTANEAIKISNRLLHVLPLRNSAFESLVYTLRYHQNRALLTLFGTSVWFAAFGAFETFVSFEILLVCLRMIKVGPHTTGTSIPWLAPT